MRGLLEYLRSPGRYIGLDVNDVRIRDAQQRITARWPNFTFVRADVHNAQDNPSGVAGSNRFPCDDASCDVVYAASLFTHLLPDEVRHYLRESRRVLKPNGRCLFSWFLLDYYRGPGTTVSPLYQFEAPFPDREGVAVRDAEHPERAIAYRTAVLEDYARDAGLRVDRVLPGLWHESPGLAVNEQDLLLLTADAG
jgi:SAM-dependent methyltransferase